MKQLGITGVIFLIAFQTSYAQISTYKGQALFIYNFTKHIRWTSNHESITIGIWGKTELLDELTTTLKGKLVDGKNLHVKTLSSPAEVAQCQIVYLPASKSPDLSAIISSINNKDVLLITESDLSEKGAGISFLTVDDKLRFKINQDVLSKNKLQVSSGLLSLALH